MCAVDGLPIEGRGGCLVGLWPGESRATFVPSLRPPLPEYRGEGSQDTGHADAGHTDN